MGERECSATLPPPVRRLGELPGFRKPSAAGVAVGLPSAGADEWVRRPEYPSDEAPAMIKRLEFSQLIRRGRLSLGLGLVFLIICLLLGQLVSKSGSGATLNNLQDGLAICGGMAMWRPLAVYLD